MNVKHSHERKERDEDLNTYIYNRKGDIHRGNLGPRIEMTDLLCVLPQ